MKIAALAALRRTDDDLARIDSALHVMASDIAAGGRGLEGDELFHGSVTSAARSGLLADLMVVISAKIRESGWSHCRNRSVPSSRWPVITR